MMRNLSITILSLVLTTIVIGNAYFQKKQFYPTVVYITKSNPSMAVIYIQAFILVILTGKLMRKVFFGELRAVELEHLMERSWYAVTETCLAFTVFRDDFSPKFVALFTLLLFLKSFHWLAEERVDFMERSPVISVLFHIRIICLLGVLGALDLLFVSLAYQSTLTKGASVQLVFGFEYAILLTIILNIVIKYTLHSTDLHRDIPWEHKAVFLLYTELIMGLIKVILYVMFVFIMVRIYTLPLFAFRPMYYTVRAFKKAFNDVIMSRRAIRNMNTLYPDATPEELAASDNVCIICREEMHPGVASKKLPCNHIFHTSCLRSWFQRQQTCPTCRLNILRSPAGAGGPGGGGVGGGVPPAVGAQAGGGGVPGGAAARGGPPLPRDQPPQPHPLLQPQAFLWPPRDQQNPNAPRRRDGGGESGPGGAATHPVGGGPLPTGGLPPPLAAAAGGGAGGPFFYSPFPFSPFNVPAPLPPFEGLSDEELRQLEGDARAALEARIRTLQNIQTLLDASIVMMQQYTSAVSASSGRFGGGGGGEGGERGGESSRNGSEGAGRGAGAPRGGGGLSQSAPQPGGSTSPHHTPDTTQTESDQSNKTSTNTTTLPTNGKASTSSETDEPLQSLTREQELARQRRLELFDNLKPNTSNE